MVINYHQSLWKLKRARGCVCVGATWAAMASPSHVFGDNTAEDLKTAESFGMG